MINDRLGIWDQKLLVVNSGLSQKVNTSDWSVEWVIFNASQGVMDVYFGSNFNPTGVPLWRFTPSMGPQWYPVVFTGDRYELTILSSGTDQLQGSIVFCSKHNRGFDYTR